MVQALVISRLDYGNALLYGLPLSLVRKLQLVQNAAAWLVSGIRKYDHVRHILKDLHWLPILQKIDYKISVLVFKSLHNLAPVYIREMLTPYSPGRFIWSRYKHLLVIPKSSSRFGDRAFSVAAPRLWNNLPLELRSCSEFNLFKKQLKTHLFEQAYSDCL